MQSFAGKKACFAYVFAQGSRKYSNFEIRLFFTI